MQLFIFQILVCNPQSCFKKGCELVLERKESLIIDYSGCSYDKQFPLPARVRGE